MTTITERVAAGAAFLDEHDPEWWREIDLDKLNLASSEVCVLGQRCPLEVLADFERVSVGELTEDDDIDRYYAYGEALMRATGDQGRVFGWAAELGFASEVGTYGDLTAEWKRLIEARRSA